MNLTTNEIAENEPSFPAHSYYTLWGFMLSNLKLRNAELMTYALIYNYFRSGEEFTGTRKYIARWTGYGLTAVDAALKNLTERGLIRKSVSYIRGVQVNKYSIVIEALPPIDMHKNMLAMCESDKRKQGVYKL